MPIAIKGIGIAHSGVIDSEAGMVLSYPRPGQMAEWKNVPLRQIFQNEFDVPCLLGGQRSHRDHGGKILWSGKRTE